MEYNTKKRPLKQSRLELAKLTQEAQEQWNEQAELLAKEKADLGYGDFEWEAFLELPLESTQDEILWSQILALQTKYKDHKEHQNRLWIEDIIIAEFNVKHAVVHTEQTHILTETVNIFGNKDFTLESRQSFKMFYEAQNIVLFDGKERNKADIWLKSPKRRQYNGIVFEPKTTENLNGFYNLWKGFSRIPKQGDCSCYWNHVKENICNGKPEFYNYVRKWVASVFQHPDEVHTALVLQGSQGVGKNSFVDPLGVLLGAHYAPLSSITELVSNFNYHLKNAVLIHANEALWGGNKKELGTVKAMITEKICLIEGKGKDRITVKNHKHIILSSNEDWPVFIDPDDRRFLVMRVSEQRKEDHPYFEVIQDQLDNGGYEALLYDLLHEDLTNFNPRKLPLSADSFSIKMRSANSAHQYIHEALAEGGFSISSEDQNTYPVWQDIIPKDAVYKDSVARCKQNGEAVLSKELFSGALKKTIVTTSDKRPGGDSRTRCYKFPSLRQAQKEFCQSFKESPERIFDNYLSDDGSPNVVQD